MLKGDNLKAMKLVDMALGVPRYTYEMQRNQPKPTGQFAAVKFLGEHNPSRDKVETIEQADGTFIIRTTGVRILTLQILFTEGLSACSQFISSFMRPDIQDFMLLNDFAILRHKQMSNDALTLESNWEVRESVLVECMVRRTFDSKVGVIDTVEIDGLYNEADKAIPLHIETKRK
ncbi:MAG: phage neck terminator protein [Bacteroidales bacterium]